MRLPTASAAVYPNSRSAAGFQPVMVPSSDFVMMASLDEFDRGAEQPLARGIMVARRLGAAMLLDLALERGGLRVAPRPSPAQMRAPARRSRRVRRPEWRPYRCWPIPSTAAVSWTIGRVSDRAINSASAAAHNTAISPTRSEVFLDRSRPAP